MQERGDCKSQSLARPGDRDPDVLCFALKGKDNEAIDLDDLCSDSMDIDDDDFEIGVEDKDYIVLGLESEKNEGNSDFLMKDDSEGVEASKNIGSFSMDVTVPTGLNKSEEKNQDDGTKFGGGIFSNEGGRFTSCTGDSRKMGKDGVIVFVADEEKAPIVLGLESEKEEAEDDFVMEDGSKDVEGFMKVVPSSMGVTVRISLEKDKEKNQVHGTEDDDGAGEWDIGGGSKDSDKHRCDDSMSYESKQESDDEFNFDSDDEKEEKKSKTYEVTPSIAKSFDMDLLRDSIQKGEESLCDIDGKNVILIIGKTGTGKSTLIQGIAGKVFTKKSFSCGGAVSKEVFEAKDPVSGFEIGHAKVSMTKHVKTFFRKGGMKDKVIYIDTPGFEDTDGEEIDIATSVMLKQIAKKSCTLRFVMMINYISLLEDRGGAMRSILKFMRNFVRDFSKEKKSFMFLFTHADEIKDVPESLEGAKRSLLEEIIRTISGTKDEGVTELLSFIRKSLEKGYPFVDILHPLKTDYNSLVDFMENRLKPTKRILDGNGSCGLTLSSQMRLGGAAQKLLRNLRVLLGRGNVDIEEVCQIQKTFEYFEKYIDFEDMRVAVKDCNELFVDYIHMLNNTIERELDNGTSFKNVFNKVNIKHLKDAISQLVAIDLSFDLETKLRFILNKVTEFQRGLFLDGSRVNFDGLHQDLQKLKCWGSFNEDCRLLLDPVIVTATAHVWRIKDEVYIFDVNKIHSSCKATLQKVFLNFKTLESIRGNARGLSLHIEGIPNALDISSRFLSRLKSKLGAMNKQLVMTGEKIDFGDEETMEALVNQIQKIEMISDLLKDTAIEKDTFLSIEVIRKPMYSQITGRFKAVCSELKDIDYGCDLEWKKGLCSLRDVTSRFSIFEGTRWNVIESSYVSVVDRMKSHLKARSGDLDEMSQRALNHGLVDGTRDGEYVGMFAKYQWFDDFLLPEEQFVQNVVTKLLFDYSKVFTASAETVEGILSRLSAAEQFREGFIDATKELKNYVSVITECKSFGYQTGDQGILDRADQLFDQLEIYITNREVKWHAILDEWTSIVTASKWVGLENLTATTESLNFVLCEVVEFMEINCKEDTQKLIISVRDYIIAALAKFKKRAELPLDSEIDYEEFANLLARVQAFGDFPQTATYLPKLGPLKEFVRQRVTKDAEKIEDMTVSAINFDEIDRLIVEFEKAKIVDEFMNDEVSQRLRTLKRLRVDREDGTEDALDTMIEQNDFDNLGALLETLKDSKDYVQKSKLKSYVRKIEKHLEMMNEKLNKSFYGTLTQEKGKDIAAFLKILEQADEDVGRYLPRNKIRNGKSLNNFGSSVRGRQSKTNAEVNKMRKIGSTVSEWKSKTNVKVNKILDNMEKSIVRADFVALLRHEEQIGICSNHFLPFLTKKSEHRITRILEDYSKLKLLIPSHIKKFVVTSFRESKELQKILNALKSLTEMHGTSISCTDLSQLYRESVHNLHDQVQELIQKVEESANETRCFDDSIEILNNLKRSLDQGLRGHLPLQIEDNCNSALRGFEDIRKQEFKINIEISSAETQLEAIGKRMDKLEWWKSSFFGLTFSGRKTYDNLQKKMSNEASTIYHQGLKALQRRDFNTLNEMLYLLSLMANTIVNHVPQVSSNLKYLKDETVAAFQVLCKDSQDALQSDNFRAFEPLFPDYRSFVLYITTLMEDHGALTSFNLVNQLVYERMDKELSFVEEKLSGFDFAIIKQKVGEFRAFGGFIADRFSIFHEQLKAVSHVKSDKWLGLLRGMISKYFQNGRDLKKLKYYAILDIFPSATKNEIKQAYEEKTAILSASEEINHVRSKFAQIEEAMNAFQHDGEHQYDHSSKPFDDQVRGLGNTLRETTRKAMREQDYDLVDRLLFNLQGIDIIEHLVNPKLDTEKIRDDIFCLVKDHVKQIRIEVDSNWSQRMYQDLNHNIKDLKVMEEKFKSYSHIFSSSWNTGIVQSVEKEIDKLGKGASSLLESRTVANQSKDEFRRCFMRMGAVLIELPQFKDFTKKVMSDVLETCLNSDWGYGFVFDLGLSLQKGEDTNDDDEVHIAQNLVTEFGHFKEVLTMVWNEETTQKPPEDTVSGIRGDRLDEITLDATPLNVDTDELLDRFFDFEAEYKSLLGEYLCPGADLNGLVKKILDIAEEMKPISCDHGFGDETKQKLPNLISGIFALFTVLKSGDSYNRIEEAPDSELKSKLLMKPHNIQIMTLLCMFGCGASNSSSLRSQLMQIRTGEGKSMILGAAAAIFGLLGFQVRCVCYSEYLSNRDYELFRDVFGHFGLLESINYSMITTLSEEATAAKGNIREMTLSLMRGNQSTDQETNSLSTITSNIRDMDGDNSNRKRSLSPMESRMKKCASEEIMLVDEVDVFFGSEFYGQTYNQVAQLKEPEVGVILRQIWEAHKQGGRRLRLADIKASTDYKTLNKKIPGYEFVLDNEISLMLDQVRRVDDEPSYHLDQDSDRIGYKIQDTISYKVTYGYRTVFAYLKEADNGKLKDSDVTLSRVLTMPISCGQFSYANIKPKRILGVSGTLEVMSDYEKNVLQKYGVSQYLYVPSVYGDSNFCFDKGGDGISIEEGVSNFFLKITDEISRVATKQKRAVIVFFSDSKRLNEYTSSAFYKKLGRKKEILAENKSANEKAHIISKAATAGQITICTAVFGRGTDFFSKDDSLENNGGVHVIQAFLSSGMSEEIQIQGRTARQGKKGSYKLILLDKDLEDNFEIHAGSFNNWPRGEIYARLCEARKKSLESDYQSIEMSLSKSKAKDKATHEYFDALLDSNHDEAKKLLKNLYCDMKKKHSGKMSLDLAFAIDVTGSMAPYGNAIASTIQSLLAGPSSILAKLNVRFPESEFKLRVAVLGFRDIDDGNDQFQEKVWSGNAHFSENVQDAICFIKSFTASTSGGSDLAEDHLGAIQRCIKWDSAGDWEGIIKAVLLLTDAPAHGYAPSGTFTQNFDNYDVRHPLGLTMDSVVEDILEKDIDLFLCSFDPVATEKFEEEISQTYYDHPSNVEGREVTLVPLLPKPVVQNATSGMMSDCRKHNIFVLDESGSMAHAWAGVVSVYNKYMNNRRQRQHDSDLISVVQFDASARVTCQLQNIVNAPTNLDYRGGGTCFSPAANSACGLARTTPQSHSSVIIFMSDGMANDSHEAANHFSVLNQEVKNRTGADLELHVIGFGGGTDTRQLQEIAGASANGRVHTASDIDGLSKVFVQISGGGNDVASVLEAEISKRISDAVTNRLSVEYLG